MASRRRPDFRAYRICKRTLPILSGDGAARYPGRWNSLGRPVVYAAETFSGAMLEILVHANIGRPPRDLHFATIVIPSEVAIEEFSGAEAGVAEVERSRRFGDAWYEEQRTAVLLVPSAVTRIERNLVINPSHPDFGRITASKPEPVIWDPRLFRE
ncbi:MAG TPA: RES domain-containing protein [Gemmatimonadaceae bacterium]|nr:RES domain-containing protein [Gemmatimonadaceae bacterium]